MKRMLVMQLHASCSRAPLAEAEGINHMSNANTPSAKSLNLMKHKNNQIWGRCLGVEVLGELVWGDDMSRRDRTRSAFSGLAGTPSKPGCCLTGRVAGSGRVGVGSRGQRRVSSTGMIPFSIGEKKKKKKERRKMKFFVKFQGCVGWFVGLIRGKRILEFDRWIRLGNFGFKRRMCLFYFAHRVSCPLLLFVHRKCRTAVRATPTIVSTVTSVCLGCLLQLFHLVHRHFTRI